MIFKAILLQNLNKFIAIKLLIFLPQIIFLIRETKRRIFIKNCRDFPSSHHHLHYGKRKPSKLKKDL